MSVVRSILSLRAVPMPWPEVLLVRRRMGFFVPLACRRAVIFREFAGSTRGSFAPVVNRIAGLVRVFHGAELRYVERPVRKQLDPQHVVDTHHGDHRGLGKGVRSKGTGLG